MQRLKQNISKQHTFQDVINIDVCFPHQSEISTRAQLKVHMWGQVVYEMLFLCLFTCLYNTSFIKCATGLEKSFREIKQTKTGRTEKENLTFPPTYTATWREQHKIDKLKNYFL